jgi:hypothetical protein
MSNDGRASIGYGFLVPKELCDDVEKLLDDKDRKHFDFMFAGNVYSDYLNTFIIIKESENFIYVWQGGSKPLNLNKIKVKPNWNEKLKQLISKLNKLNDFKFKSKIDWWLCVSS